jgi:hypothetical protein
MKQRILYKGYHVSVMTSSVGGGFQARAAIMVLSEDRTRSQRFLDFDCFRTENEADTHAIEGAKEWIDVEVQRSAFLGPTNFAAL